MFRFRLFAASLLAASAFNPCSAEWIQTLTAEHPRTPKVFAMAVIGDAVFAGFESGVFRSFDRGATWEQSNAGLPDFPIAFSMAARDSILYSGGVSDGIYRSTDLAGRWTHFGLRGKYVTTILPRGTSVYAGTAGLGLFRTRDEGRTWEEAGLRDEHIHVLAWQGKILFAGTLGGLWRSDDSGSAWRRAGAGLPDSNINVLAALESGILLAGTRAGVYRSTDSGASWSRAGLAGQSIYAVVTDGSLMFASTWGGVFQSRDAGATWEAFSAGLAGNSAMPLAISGSDLFVGVSNAGIWRRPATESEVSSIRRSQRLEKIPGKWGWNLPPVDGRQRGPR